MAKYVLVITEAILNILQCDSQMVKFKLCQGAYRGSNPAWVSFFFYLQVNFFFTANY